jgi:hypothetical protein
MNPWKVSAQFAAFLWFTRKNEGTATHEEAMHFARENWVAFLPAAHEGVGKLLIRVAKARPARRRQHQRHSARSAGKGSHPRLSKVG